MDARPAAVPIVVTAMGGVRPAQSVKLVPQVGGRVIHISKDLIPGGTVKQDAVLVRIDPRDYELAIRVARAEVTQAQLSVEIQQGQRTAARRELQLAGGGLVPTQEGLRLASRESYVENANAQLDSARSRLEQAELARNRTILRAPFDARVQERSVDVGQVVSPQTSVATIVASGEAWVEASLPTEKLRWIDIPGLNAEQGAKVQVRQKLADDVTIARRGTVLGLLPSLQENGKLARLLIGVADPFAEHLSASAMSAHADAGDTLPLLAGSFVHLDIQGRTLPDLLALPRGALRQGGKIWVRDRQGLLAFRSVVVVWQDQEVLYVRGDVRPHEQVITSHIASPLPGMGVELAEPSGAEQGGPLP